MSRAVSDALKAELFDQNMDEVAIWLVTITHPNLTDDIRLSSDPTTTLSSGVKGTISGALEFVNIPFEITLQEQSDNLLTRAVIRADNISREIMLAVQTAQGEAPNVRLQMVLASAPDTVEVDINNLKLNNVQANAFTVEAELQPAILQGEKYPANTINQADFPGVFGR